MDVWCINVTKTLCNKLIFKELLAKPMDDPGKSFDGQSA